MKWQDGVGHHSLRDYRPLSGRCEILSVASVFVMLACQCHFIFRGEAEMYQNPTLHSIVIEEQKKISTLRELSRACVRESSRGRAKVLAQRDISHRRPI